MDAVDYVRSTEGVSYEGLDVLMIRAVNVLWTCVHEPAGRSLKTEVVPRHLKQIPCAATEILRGGKHVESLVQKYPDSSLERQYCPISKKTWACIT